MDYTGTSGDDNITGTSGDDVFDLRQGGNDTAQGLGGNDVFIMGDSLNAADNIDGGTGFNTVRLFGDYSSGLTLGATTLVNIQNIQLTAGYSYDITTNNATVASGQTLNIDGSKLGAGDDLTFNGIAETNGRFTIVAGAGDDYLIGGNGNDTFDLSHGGDDVANGRAGSDLFLMGANMTAADQINGGNGFDTVRLDGDYTGANTLDFGATTMVNVENLQLAGGFSYDLIMNDANVAANHTLVVDAGNLGAGDTFTFNGFAEKDGLYDIIGGAGNNRIVGGNGAQPGGGHGDTYNLSEGGNNIVTGGSGDDTFIMGAKMTADDSLDGGRGVNTVILDGNYTGDNALVLNDSTLTNIAQITVSAGFDYSITENDANLAAGRTMEVNGDTGVDHTFTFDGSAETNGTFNFSAGSGTSNFTGGAGNDLFFGGAGIDNFNGEAGNDSFLLGPGFSASSSINGGDGNDTVTLTGGDSAIDLTFGASTITNVETLTFIHGAGAGAASFDIVENDGNVAAGQTLDVDASHLRTGDSVTFDGSAETDGSFVFHNGLGPDVFIGGALSDTFDLTRHAGATVTGGGGADSFTMGTLSGVQNDTFVYNAVSDSTSTTYDTINALDFGHALFQTSGVGGATTGIDAAVTTGSLSTATFDSDLASDIGAGQLAAHHAVLFTADAGTLAGQTFLVVDENGTAGYQAGADLVIDVTGATGTLTTANFI